MDNYIDDISDKDFERQAQLWDKKLSRLSIELLLYVRNRTDSILEYRAQQLIKNEKEQ